METSLTYVNTIYIPASINVIPAISISFFIATLFARTFPMKTDRQASSDNARITPMKTQYVLYIDASRPEAS